MILLYVASVNLFRLTKVSSILSPLDIQVKGMMTGYDPNDWDDNVIPDGKESVGSDGEKARLRAVRSATRTGRLVLAVQTVQRPKKSTEESAVCLARPDGQYVEDVIPLLKWPERPVQTSEPLAVFVQSALKQLEVS